MRQCMQSPPSFLAVGLTRSDSTRTAPSRWDSPCPLGCPGSPQGCSVPPPACRHPKNVCKKMKNNGGSICSSDIHQKYFKKLFIISSLTGISFFSFPKDDELPPIWWEGCILPGRVSSSVPSHWVLWALDILPPSLSLRAGMAGTARRKLVALDPAMHAEGMDLCSEDRKGSVWERSLVHVLLPGNFVLLFCWSALYKPFHQMLGFYLRRVWNSQQAEQWALHPLWEKTKQSLGPCLLPITEEQEGGCSPPLFFCWVPWP